MSKVLTVLALAWSSQRTPLRGSQPSPSRDSGLRDLRRSRRRAPSTVMQAGLRQCRWIVAFVIRAEWVVVLPVPKQTATQPVPESRWVERGDVRVRRLAGREAAIG
jgi:hypothetical protein